MFFRIPFHTSISRRFRLEAMRNLYYTFVTLRVPLQVLARQNKRCTYHASHFIFEALSQWATIKIHSAWIYQPLKEILLEIGFIVEMRSTWRNKEVPRTFFHQFRYSRTYDLIRLTPYHWQPCISQFRDISNSITLQKLSQTKKCDYCNW